VVLDVAVVDVVGRVVLVLDGGEVDVIIGAVLESLQATRLVPVARVRASRPTVCRHFAILLVLAPGPLADPEHRESVTLRHFRACGTQATPSCVLNRSSGGLSPATASHVVGTRTTGLWTKRNSHGPITTILIIMSTTGDNLMDKVGELLREISAQAIEPRLESLRTGYVRFKSPGEVVTVADEEAERLLKVRLGELIPDAMVIGEEEFPGGAELSEAGWSIRSTEPPTSLPGPRCGR
jgi:hypothetical protein